MSSCALLKNNIAFYCFDPLFQMVARIFRIIVLSYQKVLNKQKKKTSFVLLFMRRLKMDACRLDLAAVPL